MRRLLVYLSLILFAISISGCSSQEQSDDITIDKSGKLKFKIIATKPDDIPEVVTPVNVEEKKIDTQQLINMFFSQTPPGDVHYQNNRYESIEDDKAKLRVYPSGALRYSLKPNVLPDEESEPPITYSKEEALNKAVDYIKNHGGLPDQYETRVSSTQGISPLYVVTLKHKPINGLPVTGVEKIEVVLDSQGVREYFYGWREPINVDNTEEHQPISFEKAIDIFLDNIYGNVCRLNSNTIYTLSGGRLVYHTPLIVKSHNKWIPAWEFKIDGTTEVYVNAINGELF
ncbi:hypothetical protein SAMN05660649_03374 [Desulfotomaculum arcticum]|uniref:Peptidase propeptide and YPEB domain-containing protein n=1 Tax=Desulfotruncus arcticus DSM 17038 TaxID=1121424 RepID=A0A1I2WEM9_9FIRM|nr:hypothetical protein [Desulfotruncus arcticus]SFG98061.1 hypothetical protein SAMN05660649_03374 [Desulfotomaculum arcticum] [Desulfotruncus arcticus DSM 17038]